MADLNMHDYQYKKNNYDFGRDLDYLDIVRKQNDELWKKTEKKLYFSYKNDIIDIFSLFFMIASFFMEQKVSNMLFVLFLNFYLSYKNNRALDRDPMIIRERQAIREYRRQRGENV